MTWLAVVILRAKESNTCSMTTWAHELMFAKSFELLGKKNGVFVGAVSCLQWLMNYSSFSSSSCSHCALPQPYARPGSHRGQLHSFSCLPPATSSTPGKVGTEHRFLSGLLRDSGVMEFGSILRTLRAAGVERDVGSCPAMEEAVRLDRPICED